jgi:DNA-binding response OmpR family regulator
MSLEFLMRKNGYHVSIARNSAEALEAIDHTSFAVILLDVMMSDVDGYQVCRYVRQRPDRQAAKVVFLRAKSEDADTQKRYKVGADLYIPKPFSTRQLMKQVRALVG